MNWKLNLMTILSATGIINSLFVAVLLFFKKSRNKFSNKFLAFILLLIAIKIGYATNEQQLWQYGFMYYLYTKMAVAAYLAVIPLFIFYINSLLKKDYQPQLREMSFFVPAILYLFNPYEDFFWMHKGFYLLQIIFISYTLASTYKIARLLKIRKENPTSSNYKILNWLVIIQLALLLFWGTAFGKFIYELALLYTLVLYFLIKIAAGDFKTINLGWQYKEPCSENELILKLKALMLHEKLYLDSSLTLPKMASKMSVSLHQLSKEINQYYNQNFTEFVNSFRIEEACKMLSSEVYGNLTIESIAYDCGFNSLSSFNAAFKKQMKVTPSQFRLSNKKNFSVSYN